MLLAQEIQGHFVTVDSVAFVRWQEQNIGGAIADASGPPWGSSLRSTLRNCPTWQRATSSC